MENKDLEQDYVDSYGIQEERVTSLRIAVFSAVCLIILGLVVLGVFLVGLINAN